MNMRQSAGWLAVIVVLLAGMSLVARSSPPAAVSDARQMGGVAMAGVSPCGTSTIFASEVTPMDDWVTDLVEWFYCGWGLMSEPLSPKDIDGDGVNEIVTESRYILNGQPTVLVWAKVNGDGSFEVMPPVFLGEATLDLPALGVGESYALHVLALRDINDDGLPDAIIGVQVHSGGGFVRGRVYYTLNTLPPPPPPLIGDVDGDGIVGILDFLLVLENWTV